MYIPLYDTHLSLSVYIAVYNIRPRSLPTESRRTDPPRATPAHGARRCRGQQHPAERRCTGAVPRRARGRSFGRKPIRTTGGPSTGRSWRAVGGGRGACRWAETGVVSGEGGAWAAGAAEAASGAPEENGGLFTFCSSSANGRASARVPARRRGQLRRRPRWRRRGLALSGRCSRAQRRRAGRLLPRQVTRTAPGRAPGAAGPDLAEEGEAAGGCAAERAAEAGARAAVGRAAGASRGPGSPGRRGHGWRPAVPVGALPPPAPVGRSPLQPGLGSPPVPAPGALSVRRRSRGWCPSAPSRQDPSRVSPCPRSPARPGKMHSFGNEEAVSLERLFGFFCECVRRGDWELAQACVPQLSQWDGDGPEKVEAILQALVACPVGVR